VVRKEIAGGVAGCEFVEVGNGGPGTRERSRSKAVGANTGGRSRSHKARWRERVLGRIRGCGCGQFGGGRGTNGSGVTEDGNGRSTLRGGLGSLVGNECGGGEASEVDVKSDRVEARRTIEREGS